MRQRLFTFLGLGLICLAAIWQLILSKRLMQRLPPGWSWQSSFVGIATSPDPATGAFPQRDTPGRYERLIKQTTQADKSQPVVLEDFYIIRDPKTQQKTYEYIFRAAVDPQTGQHLAEPYRADYFVFPRDTQPTTYVLRNSYLKGLPLTFMREEELEGLDTYYFTYKGRGEYTESYRGTTEYPGFTVEPGQEIRCADDQFVFKVWVEPVTGEILKLEEHCYSGDYIYDITSGQQLAPVLRWGGVTAGDDILRRTDQIRSERRLILWKSRYVPLLLLICGCVALVAGLWIWRRFRLTPHGEE